MLQSLREETEGKLQMLLSLRKNGLTSLFKEVRVFKVVVLYSKPLRRKGKWKQRRKGDVRDVKHYHGRC